MRVAVLDEEEAGPAIETEVEIGIKIADLRSEVARCVDNSSSLCTHVHHPSFSIHTCILAFPEGVCVARQPG